MNLALPKSNIKRISRLRHLEKRQELEHRQNRLNNNIFAGICHKSILAQRKTIFYLELQINSLEYKLQHNL